MTPTAPVRRRRLPLYKKVLFAGLALLAALCCLEGLAHLLALPSAYRNWRETEPLTVRDAPDTYFVNDEKTGWRLKPGYHAKDYYGPGRSLTINQAGFRALREYDPQTSAPRVLCIGDSFMFGYGEDDASTFPVLLNAITGRECLNMAVPAYGLDQMWLRYEELSETWRHDVVVVSFITDDFRRLLIDRFGSNYYKPRFIARGGELIQVAMPRAMRQAGELVYPEQRINFFLNYFSLSHLPRARLEHDILMHEPDKPARSQEIANILLRKFSELCRKHGRQLCLVYFPSEHEFAAGRYTELYTDHLTRTREFATSEGIAFLDCHEAIAGLPNRADLYQNANWHHPTRKGFELFAEYVDQHYFKNMESAVTTPDVSGNQVH